MLKSDGSVYQFPVSFNRDEEIGANIDFSVSDKKRKIGVLSNIKQISSGFDHFVALDKDGKVFTMGDDTLGQCGLGDEGRPPCGPFYEKRVSMPKMVPSR